MIKDKIENYEKYCAMNPYFKEAFLFLKNFKFEKTARIELIKDKMFANVDKYITKNENEAKLEAHKKYIDIQYIYLGEEKIGCTDLTDTTEKELYDKEHDVVFLYPKSKENLLYMKKSDFAIFYPNDAHRPSMSIGDRNEVVKIVVKIKVEDC